MRLSQIELELKMKINTKSEEYIKKEHGLYPVEVTNNQEISPNVFLLSWKRDHSFIPGQVVKLAVDNEHPPRIYSLCSGNQEEEFHVLFNVKGEGYLTPRLAASKPGDIIFASAPYGSYSGDMAPAYWIATGTGIAPFYSMFRSGMAENKILIHGARFRNQFYFEEELDRALGKRYIRYSSRESGENIFHGRITAYLSEQNNLPADFKYYLCGQALMVVEVRDLLIDKGIPYQNIVAEIYF
jgi:ferredoxin--NADP+ reductase